MLSSIILGRTRFFSIHNPPETFRIEQSLYLLTSSRVVKAIEGFNAMILLRRHVDDEHSNEDDVGQYINDG